MYAENSKSSYAHSGQSIKIATLNLYNYVAPPSAHHEFDNIYSKEDWHEKNAELKKYLLAKKPDIIGFQEVFSPDELAEIVKEVGYAYFVVMEKPAITDGYILTQSVVCLASRFPVKHQAVLSSDPDLSIRLGVESFRYSRSPLHVVVELPKFGDTDIYVVHLKSKRVAIEGQFASLSQILQEEIAENTMAMNQRTMEATHLMHSFITHRAHNNNPAIILGDFNDDIHSEALQAFHINTLSRVFKDMAEFPISHYQLHNSWHIYRLTNTNEDEQTPYTFYRKNSGLTLDYILLTSDFHLFHNSNICEVSEYHCEDEHLKRDAESRKYIFTDHAIIDITISTKE